MMGEWQPIETAPKECDILVGGGTYSWDCDYPEPFQLKHVALVRWDKSRENWQGDNTGYQDEYYWYKPTHWQPLPEPPR